MLTTIKQVRDSFWYNRPSYDHQARAAGTRWLRQNQQCATIRCAFIDYVDMLAHNGTITESLARRVTL